MATFLDMQNRIADELGMRTDLFPQIQLAINTAIAHQDNEKFYFNEGGPTTFNTVIGQQNYDAEAVFGSAAITGIAEVDWLKVTAPGNYSYRLQKWNYRDLDYVDTNSNWQNQPYAWAFYNDVIRLFPIPQQVYPVTGFITPKFAPLVNPTDTNPWMNDGEEMIRNYAKANLYSGVLLAEPNAQQLADTCLGIGKSAKKSLRQETYNKASSGRVRVFRS